MKEKKEIKLLKRTEMNYMEFSAYLIMSQLLDEFSPNDGEIYSIIFEAVDKLEKFLDLYSFESPVEVSDIIYFEEVYGYELEKKE